MKFSSTVIQNSGSHMEHTILASVTSILIGFVVMDNQSNEEVVRRFLRDGKFSAMVDTLMQYYEFMNLTVSVSFSATDNQPQFNLILSLNSPRHHLSPN